MTQGWRSLVHVEGMEVVILSTRCQSHRDGVSGPHCQHHCCLLNRYEGSLPARSAESSWLSGAAVKTSLLEKTDSSEESEEKKFQFAESLMSTV